MPMSDYALLERYWAQEPWGPWRDNLHAAIISRAALHGGGYKAPPLDKFFYINPEIDLFEKSMSAKHSFMSMFKTIAKRRKSDRKKKS